MTIVRAVLKFSKQAPGWKKKKKRSKEWEKIPRMVLLQHFAEGRVNNVVKRLHKLNHTVFYTFVPCP